MKRASSGRTSTNNAGSSEKLMPSPQRLNSGQSVHADFGFPNAYSITIGSMEWREPRSEPRAVGMIDPAAVLHRSRDKVQRFDGMFSRREWVKEAVGGAITRLGGTFPTSVLATTIIPMAARVKDCTWLDRWSERGS